MTSQKIKNPSAFHRKALRQLLAVLLLAAGHVAWASLPEAGYCWPDGGNLIFPPLRDGQPRFLCPLGVDGALVSLSPQEMMRKGAHIVATVRIDNGAKAGVFFERRDGR